MNVLEWSAILSGTACVAVAIVVAFMSSPADRGLLARLVRMREFQRGSRADRAKISFLVAGILLCAAGGALSSWEQDFSSSFSEVVSALGRTLRWWDYAIVAAVPAVLAVAAVTLDDVDEEGAEQSSGAAETHEGSTASPGAGRIVAALKLYALGLLLFGPGYVLISVGII